MVWRIRRPRLSGVRVLARDPQGRVLLVRHSYGTRNWMPPGGGISPTEDPVAAGVRELAEETGCTLYDARLVSVQLEDLKGARNVVHVVVGSVRENPVPDRREIVEAGFFAPDALPEPMPGAFPAAIGEWLRAYDSQQG